MSGEGGSVQCHVERCDKPATVHFSCRNHVSWQWTSGGLVYCDEHGRKVADSFAAQGLDTRLTQLGRRP